MSLGNMVLEYAVPGVGAPAYWCLRRYGLGVRYWRLPDADHRRAHRDAASIRRGWKPLAVDLKLFLKDQRTTGVGRARGNTQGRVKLKTPKIKKITTDQHGVTIKFKLVPRVRLDHFVSASEDLANYWGMVRVDAEQTETNHVTVRAVRRDPLIIPTDFAPVPADRIDLRHYTGGIDGFGRPARIRMHHGSGVCVYGLPNSGKTSFLLGMISTLAPSDSVVFLIADGKSMFGYDGDYMDVAPRALSVIGNDLQIFNFWIKQIQQLRAMRASTMRQALGVRNFWDHGPTPDWPLIVPIVDECHVFFEQTTAHGDPEQQHRNALASSNAYECANLVRMCQNVGILPWFLTQKGTADAIPTMISHNCHGAVCFPVKTPEAAVAALRDQIMKHPSVNPMNFQAEQYVGVATTYSETGSGYTQFRSPFCRDAVASDICERTARLVRPETAPMITIGTDHRLMLSNLDPMAELEPKRPIDLDRDMRDLD